MPILVMPMLASAPSPSPVRLLSRSYPKAPPLKAANVERNHFRNSSDSLSAHSNATSSLFSELVTALSLRPNAQLEARVALHASPSKLLELPLRRLRRMLRMSQVDETTKAAGTHPRTSANANFAPSPLLSASICSGVLATPRSMASLASEYENSSTQPTSIATAALQEMTQVRRKEL